MSAIESPAIPTPEAAGMEEAEFLPWTGRPRARILSVSAARLDHTTLYRMIDHTAWQLAAANTCREAYKQLRKSGALAVFSDCDLPDGSWKDLLAYASEMIQPPAVIVTSRLADAYLWSEVLNLGGFDVLAKPFIEKEVRQVLASALRCHVEPVRRTRAAGV
jgi:DNA-binding NtrC family response regulator